MTVIQDDIIMLQETVLSLTKLLTKLNNDVATIVTINPNPSGPINTHPTIPPTPTTDGSGTISGSQAPSTDLTSVQSCVLINQIIDEKPGAMLNNIVLTMNDFDILKSNDHVFTVIPVNPPIIKSIPTIGIRALAKWVSDNSITKVPFVPADAP